MKKTLIGLSLLVLLAIATVASASHKDNFCPLGCCDTKHCAQK
jgi:hypothetical protein